MKEIINDLTSLFTQKIKDNGNVIAAYYTVDTKKDVKAIEIVFNPLLSKEHKNGLLLSIAKSLHYTCIETEMQNEQDGFLELMDGMQIKEWGEGGTAWQKG